jgi:Ca2+-binding RTX toxin-like protein
MDTTLANNLAIDADLSSDADLLPSLEDSLSLARVQLQKFANDAQFQQQLTTAFGDRANLNSLQSDLKSGDFRILSGLEILPGTNLGSAKGAYGTTTDRIYLSQEFLRANQHNPQALASVILEEVGHRIDVMFNTTDSPGDEGKIFSRIVQDIPTTDVQLQQLKTDDDHSTLTLQDGSQIGVEQAGSYLGSNLKDLKLGLDQALDTLQKAVNGQALGNSLPLLGDKLKDNPAAQFITKLKTEIDNQFAKLPNLDNPTADDIKQVLQAAASKLGILKEVKDLQELESADRVEYMLKVSDIIADKTSLQSDLGLENLGLKVSGDVDTKLGYDFTLGFGVDKTKGFFLDTSTAPLDLKLAVATPALTGKAALGFLNFSATDAGTSFSGDFKIKLKNPNPNNLLFLSDLNAIGTRYGDLVEAKLTGDADIELKLLADTGKGLPSVSTDLAVQWAFNASLGGGNKATFGGTPSVSFNRVTVDAGSFISDLIDPILKDVKTITDPLQPMVDVLFDPLPVINASLFDVASTLSPSTTEVESSKKFVRQLKELADLAKTIPQNPGELKIELGSFTIGGDIRSTKASDSTATANPNPVALKAQALAAADEAPSAAQDFLDKLKQKKTDPDGSGLDLAFPLLTDGGKTAVDLLLGKDNISLFSFTPPLLKFSDDIPLPKIPIGPVVLKFAIKYGASAGITIGYDNLGLKEFQASGDAEKLLDGFYASKPTTSTGKILGDNLTLFAQLDASAGISLGIVDLTVGGGIRGEVSFGLIDKVRPAAFIANPLCAFNTHGKLSAIIFGEVSIDFGFYDFTQRLELADITIAEFDKGCDPSTPHYNIEPEADPDLEAELAGQGIIDRVGTNGDDRIVVTHRSDGSVKNSENLRVTGLDPAPGKDYDNVKLIVIKGRDGNDIIDLSDVRTVSGQISGGNGNDTMIGGAGNDFFMGGAGNNSLDGRGGKNTVDYSGAAAAVNVNLATGTANNGYGGTDAILNVQNAVGSRYDDTLIASDANAVLQGGAGDDRLLGGKGDDVLMGGSGKNYLDGGGGTNTVSYLYATGSIAVNLSSLNVGNNSPVIAPTDASVVYLDANTAQGGYGVIDDTIKKVQNLQGSAYDDILVAGDAGQENVVNVKNNVLIDNGSYHYEGPSDITYRYTGSYIDGYYGNDLIYAGAGSDVLDGSQGVNYLSYSLSTAAVKVDLTPGTIQSGGYAEGDKIVAAKDEYNDNKGKFIIKDNKYVNFSSFQNLEGSNFDDTLRGDDGDNIIRGGGGKDTIYANGGNDTLIGGAGADFLSGDAFVGTLRSETSSASIAGGDQGGGNTASYADSPGGVTVNLATHLGQRNDAQGDQLYGIQNLIGSDHADVLIGGSDYAHDFNPGLSKGGTDVVQGGTFGTNSLTVDYSLSDYGQGVKGGFTSARAGGLSRFSNQGNTLLDAVNFTNIDRLFLTGTIQDDVITGGANAKGDVVFASAGNDSVTGGGGSDYLDGGDGIDTLSEYIGLTNQSIKLKGVDPADPNAQQFNGTNFSDSSIALKNFEVFKDITTGSGADDSIIQLGRIDNNFIKTGTGKNYIDAGLGFDTVDGGRGGANNLRTLHIDYSQGDTGGGMQFYSSSGRSSGSGSRYISLDDEDGRAPLLDRINFKNFDNYEVTGTSKKDFIFGGDGNDTLSGGSSGYDYLDGDRGNDILRASAGGSTLTGTNNDDRGFDTITPPPPGGFFSNTVHTYDLASDQDTLYGGAGADTFVLGDAVTNTRSINFNSPGGIYYAHSTYDGSKNSDTDFASIINFDPTKGDAIQLRNLEGYNAKYTVSSIGGGISFLSLGYTDRNGKAQSDYLATIGGNFVTLDLKSSAFKYVGDPYVPPIIN